MTRVVSYKLAVELCKKGFNEECVKVYDCSEESSFTLDRNIETNESYAYLHDKIEYSFVTAPTYQDVEEWFSANHDIDFIVDLAFSQHPAHNNGDWMYEGYEVIVWKDKHVALDLTAMCFTNKYDALNKAFEEALKLI